MLHAVNAGALIAVPEATTPGAVVERVDELLEATYRSGDLGNLSDVLAETVHILLSRQTRETVYRRVFGDLRRRFATWSSHRDAAVSGYVTSHGARSVIGTTETPSGRS